MRFVYDLGSEWNSDQTGKNPCTWSTRMYRKDNPNQLTFEDFHLPFGGHLRRDNRWVILSEQIPWRQIEEAYGQQFSEDNPGAPGPGQVGQDGVRGLDHQGASGHKRPRDS